MRSKHLSIALLAAMVISCKTEPDIEKQIIKPIEIEKTADVQLKLNDGKKWLANTETHEGITNMESIIKTFKNGHEKNYRRLGEDLSKQSSYVIKNCTMKGESHDQLHAVLVPMLDEITIFKEADIDQEASIALKRLENLIVKYYNHFDIK
jgi:hypothetical protein